MSSARYVYSKPKQKHSGSDGYVMKMRVLDDTTCGECEAMGNPGTALPACGACEAGGKAKPVTWLSSFFQPREPNWLEFGAKY